MEEETSTKDVDKHKKEPDVCCDPDNLSPLPEENSIFPPDRTESETAPLENHSETSHHLHVTPSEERNNNLPSEDKEMAKVDDNLAFASSALTKRTLQIEEHIRGTIECETKLQVLLLETIPSGELECDPLSAVVDDSANHDETAAEREGGVCSSDLHDSHASRPAMPTEQSTKSNVVLVSSPQQKPLAVDSVSQSCSRTPPSKQKPRKKSKDDSSCGRWTAEEHREFLRGLQIHGREWKKVATLIPSRSSAQVRSHAQKYFVRLQRTREEDQEHNGELKSLGSRDECASTCSSTLQHSIRVEDVSISTMPLSVRLQAERILSQPETVQAEVNLTLERLRVRYRQLQEQLSRRQQSAAQNNEASRVEGAHENESVGAGSIESLHHEELIALHVLQGGLASTNESENDVESETMVSTTKMNESIDPNADYQSTTKRRRLD